MDQYPFHIDLYRRDTRHLSPHEDGVYRRLIDEYMADECPLPDNDKALASVARIPLEDWRIIAPTIKAFFDLKGGRLIHRRCEIEIARWRRYSKFQSEKGKKRHAEHDKIVNDLSATAEPRLNSGSAEPQPSLSHERERENEKERTDTGQVNGSHVISVDWQPSQQTIDTIRMTYHLTAEEVANEIPRFRDKQISAGNLKADWDAAFRHWCSNFRKYADLDRARAGSNGNGRGHRPKRRSDAEIIAEVAAKRSVELGES